MSDRRYKEHLLWIPEDRNDDGTLEDEARDGGISREEWAERRLKKHKERIRKRIDFVHALGFKCDSVGWCSLDLDRPDIDELLDRIFAHAQGEEMRLRGFYTRENGEFDSEWYLLGSVYLSNDEWDYAEVVDRDGNPLRISEIYAYKIPKTVQVLWDTPLPGVSEAFRECCLKHGFSGVDFYWIRDVGRYRTGQFFGLIIDRLVPEFACDRYLSYSKATDHGRSADSPLYRKYLALGGRLPKLFRMFDELKVRLPVRLPEALMPETDFAYIHYFRGGYDCRDVLIRRRAAEILLNEKAIRKEYLTPVELYDSEPEGLTILKSEPVQYPSPEVVRKLESDYEELKRNPKPERKASEKDALRLFRQIKRIRPEDFNKGLARRIRESLAATPYGRLSPYYAIADGGWLSDEYELLPWSESVAATREYAVKIEQEELLPDRYEGIVIARCADGDIVLACDDGPVRRISHETMDVCESWDTAAQFFYDVLSDG